MRDKRQDIIATSNLLEFPDIFFTRMCNPNWLEIIRALPPGKNSAESSDLCNRLFRMKRDALITFVKTENLLEALSPMQW